MSDEQTIPQMRDTIDRLQKSNTAKDETIAGLELDIRGRDAADVFKGEGFNPKHAQLYVNENPEGEITPETVNAFAEQWDLSVIASGSDDGGASTSDADGADDQNKAAMSGGGSSAGDEAGSPAVEMLTRQEWMELNAVDPAAAKAAVASGRVQVSADNPWSREPRQAVGGANPYAKSVESSES